MYTAAGMAIAYANQHFSTLFKCYKFAVIWSPIMLDRKI